MHTSEAYQLLKEKQQKEELNKLILEVEHGSFMSMVMSEYGGIRKEDNKFYNCLNSDFFYDRTCMYAQIRKKSVNKMIIEN